MFLTRPARFCTKIFCGLVAPFGRGFGFAQLKRSAGTHFPTAHLTLLFFVPHSRGALWKECSRPAVMQKVRETAQQPLTPLLRKKQHHPFPASLFCLLLPQKNLGVVLTTDSFTHPLTMLHKADSPYFSSARSPERIHLLWHTWTSPVQNRDKMSDTIRRSVCSAPFLAPSSHYGTNCPAFSCHTSCIQ